MKKFQVSAPAYGMIADGFATRYAATKFARQWERENGFGRGVASVSGYYED